MIHGQDYYSTRPQRRLSSSFKQSTSARHGCKTHEPQSMDRQSGACSAIFRMRLVCQLVVLGQTSLAVVLQLVERFAVSRSAADRALRCRTALELPDCCDSLSVYNGFFMNIQRQRTRDGGVFPPWRSCCCSVAVSGGSNASAFALHHSGNRLN